MFDADDALLPGPVPRHPGDRASAADPVQEAGGRRGGAEWAVQLRLPVFLLATRVAEGRRVLDVTTLPSKMRRVPKYRNFRSLSQGVLGIVNFKISRYSYFEQ